MAKPVDAFAPIPIGQERSITCHAWNKDGSMIAVCPNSNEVQIHVKSGAEWKLEHTLSQHDSIVTGIDWAPKTNRIVTCSQDRNAYVWNLDAETGTWKPHLVILRINRCATDVKWSPNEDKFAVASGAKVVSVCHFEEESDWWVSKHIKKHNSTVTKVAWHPNNTLLATASTDCKARVFSAAIKGVDKRPELTAWGDAKIFGDLLGEFDCLGWVQAVAFSPSGNRLAFSGHDSTITFVEPVGQGSPANVCTVRLPGLPLTDAVFTEETSVVAVGHDCMPLLFTARAPGQWEFVRSLDEKKEAKPAAGAAAGGAAAEKFKMFQNLADKGTSDSGSLVTSVETKHQNSITSVQVYKRAGSKITELSTTALDGNMVFWKI